MLRNIHFFNIKPGADERRILHLLDNDLAEHARGFGCIERRTWKLLDARSCGQPAPSAMYMNEALWPSQQKADEWTRAERPEEIKKAFAEVLNGIEVEKTVRYVDAEG